MMKNERYCTELSCLYKKFLFHIHESHLLRTTPHNSLNTLKEQFNFTSKSMMRSTSILQNMHVFIGIISIVFYIQNIKHLLQTITFQWLLITDGQSTFTVFNYIDVNLESIGNKKITIGYQYKTISVKNQYSNTRRAFKMSENPGNRGRTIHK